MILLALGSNLDFCGMPPATIMIHAVRAIGKIAPIERVSQLYAYPAWPDPQDPVFCNAVVALKDAPPAETLLDALQGVEAAFGRRRTRRNAPRTLDIDILAYGDARSFGPRLILPHPGLEERLFVLEPLAEIAPAWVSPRSGRSVGDLIRAARQQHEATAPA